MKSYQQRKSQRQEKYAARDVGGLIQPGSGSQDHAKGDVRVAGKLRIECKTTSKMQYTLHLDDLRKIRLEALRGKAEDWAFQVEFQGQAGHSKKLAVVDRLWFVDLGGIIPATPLVQTDKKSTILSVSMASQKPWFLLWSMIGPKMTQSFGFAICTWQDFLDLYTKKNGTPQ